MDAPMVLSFQGRLARFMKILQKDRSGLKTKLIFIVMANTHDPEIAKGCAKDVKAMRTVFKNICRHTDFGFCDITISGKDYNRENLLEAIDRFAGTQQ